MTKAFASVTLTHLTQTYDGTARIVGATTDPTGLTVNITYDGRAWAPTNAGRYAVTGIVVDINYQGLQTDTLVVAKAGQTITNFPFIGNQLVTNVVHLSAQASSGLPVAFAGFGPQWIEDTNLTFTGAGEVTIVAMQLGNENWSATPVTSQAFVVRKAFASVTLTHLTQTYDGTARIVAATTDPAGLTVDITYDGHAWAPTNAGSYAMTGTVNSVMYQGSQVGTLVVSQADQTIDFPNPGPQIITNKVGLSATASSGLPVAFVLESGPGEIHERDQFDLHGRSEL